MAVQSIYLAVPVLMASLSGLGTKLSARFGRAQTMAAVKVVGVSLLVTMAVLADRWFPDVASADEGHADARSTTKALLVATSLCSV